MRTEKTVKKKTIITTETHEVWVIRQAGQVFAEENEEHQESEDAGESPSLLIDYDPDNNESEAQESLKEITRRE